MNKNESQPSDTSPKKRNFLAKLVLATGVGFIGTKLSMLGLVLDANNILGKNLTLKEKLKAAWNGTLTEKIWVKSAEIYANASDGQNITKMLRQGTKEFVKMFKYSYGTMLVGAAAGGILGWVRADKIEKTSDVFVHPLRSALLILGLKKPAPKQESNAASNGAVHVTADAVTADDSGTSTRWQETVSQPANSAALNR